MTNKPLNIKQLLKLCEQEVRAGHGDYSIMISDDDEGNGYHYLWYSFTTADKMIEDCSHAGLDLDPEEIILGLDEKIAKLNKTIILG